MKWLAIVCGVMWLAVPSAHAADLIAGLDANNQPQTVSPTYPLWVTGNLTFSAEPNATTDITQWGGSQLGAMASYGTSPGAVPVPGVNAYITNVPTVNVSGVSTAALQTNGTAKTQVVD